MNRKSYQYRKFLRNRYNQMQDSVQNSAERYKTTTIDLSLPEIAYLENKRQSFNERQTNMSPGLSSNANNEKIASFEERDLSNLRGRD
jgi:hypothetical protein